MKWPRNGKVNFNLNLSSMRFAFLTFDMNFSSTVV